MSAALAPLAGAQKAYVSNGYSADVSVIDTATNVVVSTIPVGTSPGRLALSADGRFVFVPNAGSDTVSVVSTASDLVTGTIAVGDGPAIAAVSPDGARLYVGGTNGLLAVVDTKLGAQIGTITTGEPASGAINGLAVSPDGAKVYALWGNLVVIDAATDTVTNSIYAGNGTNDLALTPDGTRLYVSDGFGYGAFSFTGTVALIDATSETFSSTMNVWYLPTSLAISPDGARGYVSLPYRFVNTGYGAGYLTSPWVERFDTSTNLLDSGANAGLPPGAVAFTPDGARLYAAVPTGNRVAVVDTATNAVLTTVTVGTGPSGIAITHPASNSRTLRLDPGTRRS